MDVVLQSPRDELLLSMARQFGMSSDQTVAAHRSGQLEATVMSLANGNRVIKIYGVDYNVLPIDAEEFNYFIESFLALLGDVTSVERKIYIGRARYVLAAIQAVKQSGAGGQTNPRFKGFNPADNELGIQLIRPGHVGLAATIGPLTYNNWLWGPGAIGGGGVAFPNAHATGLAHWNNWIGTLAAPYVVGGTFGDCGIIGLSVISKAGSPLIDEVRYKSGDRADLVPMDSRRLEIFDNVNQSRVIPIPTFITPPRVGLFLEGYMDIAGDTEIALGGFTIGLGRYLHGRDYTLLGNKISG